MQVRQIPTLAAASLLSLSLPPPVLGEVLMPPPPSQRDVHSSVQEGPRLRSGQMSEAFKSYQVREPLLDRPYTNVFLNSWTLGAESAALHAHALSGTLRDDMRVFYSEDPRGRSATDESRTLGYAISALSRELYRALREGKEIHLVTAGTGTITLMGVMGNLASTIEHEEPLKQREYLQRLHVLVLGDPGNVITTGANGEDQEVPALVHGLPRDLGSLFVIRRVTSEGEVLDDTQIDSDSLINQVFPHVTPAMLRESGKLDVQVDLESTAGGLGSIEIARARETIRQVTEQVEKHEFRLVLDQVRVAAERAERGDLAAKISEQIETLRMLEYRTENIESEQERIASQLEEINKVLNGVAGLVRELEQSNEANGQAIRTLAASVRRIQSTLVSAALLLPRKGVGSLISIPIGEPTSTDFDGDGVSNQIEAAVLERWRPVLAMNDSGESAPVSVHEYRSHADQLSDRLDLREKIWPTAESRSVMYGRVVRPEALQRYGENVHLAQYYVLFPYNLCLRAEGDTQLVNAVDLVTNVGKWVSLGLGMPILGAVLGIGEVEIQALDGREKEAVLGNHEGDLLCIEVVVDVVNEETGESRMLFMVVHNHGRQYAVEPSGVSWHRDPQTGQNRPIVYAEDGNQELHFNSAEGGFSGMYLFQGVNKIKRGFVDENTVIHDHYGGMLLSNIPVWNVGEVKTGPVTLREMYDEEDSPVHEVAHLPLVNQDGRTTHVDSRSFNVGSRDYQLQRDSEFLLTYPHSIGNSYYRLYVTVGIPFTSLRKKVVDERFNSPSGAVFNSGSVETDENEVSFVRGKMWTRHFRLDGLSPHENPTTSPMLRIERSSQGNTLRWESVPWASAYLIRISAPGKEDELVVPGMGGSVFLKDMGGFTSYEHNSENGWEPGVEHRYSVEALWSDATRFIPTAE